MKWWEQPAAGKGWGGAAEVGFPGEGKEELNLRHAGAHSQRNNGLL